MRRPDERTQKAINRLRFTEEFPLFRAWLENVLRDNDMDLRKVAPDRLGYYQGQAAILTAILTETGPRE